MLRTRQSLLSPKIIIFIPWRTLYIVIRWHIKVQQCMRKLKVFSANMAMIGACLYVKRTVMKIILNYLQLNVLLKFPSVINSTTVTPLGSGNFQDMWVTYLHFILLLFTRNKIFDHSHCTYLSNSRLIANKTIKITRRQEISFVISLWLISSIAIFTFVIINSLINDVLLAIKKIFWTKKM